MKLYTVSSFKRELPNSFDYRGILYSLHSALSYSHLHFSPDQLSFSIPLLLIQNKLDAFAALDAFFPQHRTLRVEESKPTQPIAAYASHK